MKNYLNTLIATLLSYVYKLKTPRVSGDYFVQIKPEYLSQFIGIYPQSISPTDTLDNIEHIKKFGADDASEFSFWSWRNCGIACVKMILSVKKRAGKKKIMDLTKECIGYGGYTLYENAVFVDRGWFHHALTTLLEKNDVKAKMKKWQSIDSVASDIANDRLTILSVSIPGRKDITPDGLFESISGKPNVGHLVLATGFRVKDNEVVGLFVHDPRGLESYQADLFIPKHIFERIFSNRSIVAW